MKISFLNTKNFKLYKKELKILLKQAYILEFPQIIFKDKFFKTKIKALKSYLKDENTLVLIVLINSKLCGFLWAFSHSILGEKSLHINQIIIHQAYRRAKLASFLLQNLENEAVKLKIYHLNLQVKSHLKPALKFYKKNAFKTEALLMYKILKKED